jgi:hypothetical protein
MKMSRELSANRTKTIETIKTAAKFIIAWVIVAKIKL